jgi:hypothetical protein
MWAQIPSSPRHNAQGKENERIKIEFVNQIYHGFDFSIFAEADVMREYVF